LAPGRDEPQQHLDGRREEAEVQKVFQETRREKGFAGTATTATARTGATARATTAAAATTNSD